MNIKVNKKELKEIIRKGYLNSKKINEDHLDESMKTQICNILSNFFSNENNVEFEEIYDRNAVSVEIWANETELIKAFSQLGEIEFNFSIQVRLSEDE